MTAQEARLKALGAPVDNPAAGALFQSHIFDRIKHATDRGLMSITIDAPLELGIPQLSEAVEVLHGGGYKVRVEMGEGVFGQGVFFMPRTKLVVSW